MTSIPTSCISNKPVPNKYVSPSEKIQGPIKKVDIPIIDLQDETNVTSQILKASETMGIFQVINHGIPIEKMKKAMKNIKDFHDLPIEEKMKYPLETDTNKFCVLVRHDSELMIEYESWRDALQVQCTRFDESIKFWPDNPKNFKEEMGEHVLAVKDFSSRILEHLSEGLGFERGYLGGEVSANYSLSMNHYPPSPDPKTTLGLQKHMDWSIITILQSDHVPGLQLFKDDQWFDVETPPEAFLVFTGSQIEVITNGKLRAASHRVTTSSESRYSASFGRFPPPDCLVEPAKNILKVQNSPPIYRSFRFKDIADTIVALSHKDKDVDVAIREILMTIN